MNQQQQENMFAAYGAYPLGNPNRSPSSARPGYSTTSSMSTGNRINQRQLDPIGQLPSGLYNNEDRFSSYEGPAFRNPRGHAQPGFAADNNFMLGNNQSWSYNAGAATVNGAMGDVNRLRSSNRRGALPSDWTSMPDSAGLPNGPQSQHFSAGGGLMPQNGSGAPRNNRSLYADNFDTLRSLQQQPDARMSSDLIPTAIVIKNIPFNYRKEMLTELMSSLHLPQPYAFNYHFDNGIFRGLAFANFQSAEDTYTVIQALNGYEVNGRKLRVEYKKMLPEHERERIEREKREKRGQLEEQHRPMLHQQSSIHSLNNPSNTGPRTSPLRKSPRRVPGGVPPDRLAGDVDLNDPETLSFYTELTLFRNDPDREILVYPTDITPQQRRIVHILAHNMGLEHRSVGEGQNRQLHVIKNGAAGVSPTAIQSTMHLNTAGTLSDAHRRGLSRAATIDFADARGSNALGPYGGMNRQGKPTLAVPDSPENPMNLRGVKSFADLRSYTPSPSPSISGYTQTNGSHASAVLSFGDYGLPPTQTSSLTTPTTPGGTNSSDAQSMLLSGSMATMNLSESSFASGQLRPVQQNPGAIGSQRPGMNGPNDWPETVTGFGGRGRANGHVPRGSDASDNAARAAAGANTPRFQ